MVIELDEWFDAIRDHPITRRLDKMTKEQGPQGWIAVALDGTPAE
jgi:hypothetical protein